MKMDVILEALQPTHEMNEEFAMALKIGIGRKEAWAVQMNELSEALKHQARIYDEMHEATKKDWLLKKL